MGSRTYFSIDFSLSQDRARPFIQKYVTCGGWKVFQFGGLGLFVRINYGYPK